MRIKILYILHYTPRISDRFSKGGKRKHLTNKK